MPPQDASGTMPKIRIKDLPIAIKSLLAPAAGALITISIVVVVTLVNSGAIETARRADEAEKLASAVSAARLEFAQGSAALFRALTWRLNKVEASRIAAARNEAEGAIARGTDLVQKLVVAERDRARVEALAKQVIAYKTAAQQTSEMIRDDPPMATMFMNDAHERSVGVAAAFQEFSAELAARAGELRARASQNLQQGIMVIIAVAGGGILFALGIAIVSARYISRPITVLTSVVSRLAAGDLSASISNEDRNDEIGAMTRSVIVLKRNTTEMRRLETEQKETEARSVAEKQAVAEREAAERKVADQRAAAERKGAMHKLADEFEKAVGHIIASVSSASVELEAAAHRLTKTAETTQQLSGMVASASEVASANVQSVASAAEEMTGSVGEISRQVHESSKIAGEAVHQAQKTNVRISELSQAAGRIGDVIKLITSVAEQTNLLALNATIEAARAGAAGRGFAVVAQEVKALAGQTAKATEEIGVQIAGMQTATQDSVAAIKEIDETITRISGIAATIAAAVEEQGAATQEISRNVQEAAKGTAEVATNITDVNRGASETGSASTQVLASAQSLAKESTALKHEVAKFLDTVRAA